MEQVGADVLSEARAQHSTAQHALPRTARAPTLTGRVFVVDRNAR